MNKFDTNDATTAILDNHGAFFAFSNAQMLEQMQPSTKYVGLGAGLICPDDNAAQLLMDLNRITKTKIEWELEHNSKKDIIWYELSNHECQISMNYNPVVERLEPYGITEEEIKAEWGQYFQNCVENDYF